MAGDILFPAPDMEGNSKYKRRILGAEKHDTDTESLKEQYEVEEKQELVVQRRSVMKLSKVYSAVAGALMAVLALVGVISLLRPELRAIMAEIVMEAVREIQGF